jgi:cyclin-dependent kinase regulatory subunit CKS1
MPHGDITQRIEYSEKYFDETSEYRHVILPRELAKQLPKNRLLSENEWRGIGVQQSRGWQHYAVSPFLFVCSWPASLSETMLPWDPRAVRETPRPNV